MRWTRSLEIVIRRLAIALEGTIEKPARGRIRVSFPTGKACEGRAPAVIGCLYRYATAQHPAGAGWTAEMVRDVVRMHQHTRIPGNATPHDASAIAAMRAVLPTRRHP